MTYIYYYFQRNLLLLLLLLLLFTTYISPVSSCHTYHKHMSHVLSLPYDSVFGACNFLVPEKWN